MGGLKRVTARSTPGIFVAICEDTVAKRKETALHFAFRNEGLINLRGAFQAAIERVHEVAASASIGESGF